ncbi:MAG: UDP binding domain-containing protein, partial [Pseudomonadota bacterium]
AQEYGASSRIVESVVEVNASQKAHMVSKIKEALDGSVADKNIAVLGLTFKPETDDMRDAPSLAILPALVDRGANIVAHDPEGMDEAKEHLPDAIHYAETIDQAVEGADAIILLTEWNQYRGLNLTELKAKMAGNVFIDLRNVYEREPMEQRGFAYTCVGR